MRGRERNGGLFHKLVAFFYLGLDLDSENYFDHVRWHFGTNNLWHAQVAIKTYGCFVIPNILVYLVTNDHMWASNNVTRMPTEKNFDISSGWVNEWLRGNKQLTTSLCWTPKRSSLLLATPQMRISLSLHYNTLTQHGNRIQTKWKEPKSIAMLKRESLSIKALVFIDVRRIQCVPCEKFGLTKKEFH